MKHYFPGNYSHIFQKTLLLASLLLLTTTSAAGLSTKGVEIHDAWAREAPPNTEVMAAYLTLHNHSAKTFTLVRVSSADFDRVEMHRSEQHDGMTMMHPVSRVMLSANGSVSFQPGGMHLMLMKPKKQLKSGDSISLSLFFSDESSLQISVPVKKGTGNSGHESINDENHNENNKENNENQHHSHSH